MTPVTAAYVMDRPGLIFRDEDADYLNQLNFSFALVKDGCVSGDHWKSIDAYKAYVAKHPHILPVVSIGGWGADGFSQAASTEAGRKQFVDTAMALVQAHGFLGIDMDWEYPGSDAAGIAASPEDKRNFTLLMKGLRDGLDALTRQDGKKRLLACALGASADLVSHIECAAVGALVDQVNLMTYDMYTSGVCSHHTALYTGNTAYPTCADQAVKDYTAAGIPSEKIMLGCAFYGRRFPYQGEADAAPYAKAAGKGGDTVPYSALTEPNYTFHFDEIAKAAYALGENAFVSYDSPKSIAYKQAYMQEKGLMGMMCWEYSGDPDGWLLRAMYG